MVPKERQLEELFRDDYQSLVRALSVVSGSRENAADAVQDAFVQAFRHWRRVQRYDDPAAWIRRVALNRLANQRRNRRRRDAMADRIARERVEYGDEQPIADELFDAVRRLPLQQRTAVALFYLLDEPVAEIAELMSIAPATVRSHLHDARRSLERTMGVKP